MAMTVPAMKARLGNTEYYILSMKANRNYIRVYPRINDQNMGK